MKRNTGEILDISQSVPGSIHDKKLFEMSRAGKRAMHQDKPCYFHLDKGYQGIEKEYPDLNFVLPKKANRWSKFSSEDKLFNKALSSIQVKVEDIICYLKKYKALSWVYRHHLKDYNQRFKIILLLLVWLI